MEQEKSFVRKNVSNYKLSVLKNIDTSYIVLFSLLKHMFDGFRTLSIPTLFWSYIRFNTFGHF